MSTIALRVKQEPVFVDFKAGKKGRPKHAQ